LILEDLSENRKQQLIPAYGSSEDVEEALQDYFNIPTKNFEELPKQFDTTNSIL